MSVGKIDTFKVSDISIKDLVLDDLAGYRDMLNDIDENIIDRQASTVLDELYGDSVPPESEMQLTVKRFVAGHTVLQVIPALRTYIARNEIRSDTAQPGAITRYDQLGMLDDLQVMVQQRVYALQNAVQIALADTYSVGPPQYDRIRVSPSAPFVTLDPFSIGRKMFENEDRPQSS